MPRRGFPKKVDTRHCASKDVVLGRGGFPKKIDTRRCASKDATLKGGSLKEVDTRHCASKDAGPGRGGFSRGPTSIKERNECQQGHWKVIPHSIFYILK